jgi:hypothetical protein
MAKIVTKKLKSSEKLRLGLRVVFYREGSLWIAHCLEMDVMGHDRDKTKALDKLIDALSLQISASIRENNHANIFMPADGRFFEMYAAGDDIADMELVVDDILKFIKPKNGVTIDKFETREYSGALVMN